MDSTNSESEEDNNFYQNLLFDSPPVINNELPLNYEVPLKSSDGVSVQIPIMNPISPNKLNKAITYLLAIILVALFVLLESKILNLPYEMRSYFLGPYLGILHEWILFLRSIYTFLNKNYPENNLTKTVDSLVLYAVDSIPNESIKGYLKTMPQTIALRPHVKTGLKESLLMLKTPETTKLIKDALQLSKLSEDLFEVGRILNIDIMTFSAVLANKKDMKYVDYMHVINSENDRLDAVMTYFKNLYDAALLNPLSSELPKSILDFKAADLTSQLLIQCNTVVYELDSVLQDAFNNPTIGPNPAVEEIDGGRKKTKNKKTKNKKTKNKKTKNKKSKKVKKHRSKKSKK